MAIKNGKTAIKNWDLNMDPDSDDFGRITPPAQPSISETFYKIQTCSSCGYSATMVSVWHGIVSFKCDTCFARLIQDSETESIKITRRR